MGLDIALGILILVGAVRGWFRGFLIQAIRLAGLVGAAYAALPIRDLARPYVAKHLASIRPELLDRLLWWASAVVFYVVTVGIASLAVRMQRRRPFGEDEPIRTDQFGGFLLGAGKGLVGVAFLVAALQKYAVDRVKAIPWADEQAKTSYALKWDAQYHPAERVWASSPVQHFVTQVRTMGVGPLPTEAEPSVTPLVPEALQAAAGLAPKVGLELPRVDLDLDPEVLRSVAPSEPARP